MTNAKNTKRALLLSVLSMMLCVAMLAGSTFAWFTDTVSTGKNQIIAGNLDVELEYLDADGVWQKVTEETKLFSELEADGATANLWEPGHTEVVYLKISNVGTLALKYQFGVNVANEVSGTNKAGNSFNLSDYLVFGQAESDAEIAKYATREAAWEAAGKTLGLSEYTKTNKKLLPDEAEYVALIVYMPTDVGNEANYMTDTAIPTIDLGVNLFATQTPHESDSFGTDYDEDAPSVTYNVTAENIQEYLNGEHGSMTNAKLVLAPGNYGQLVIGAPDKYEGSDTVYACITHPALTFTTVEEYNAHLNDGSWHHSTAHYTRTIENLTIVGGDGVTVAGLSLSSGHVYGDNILDPVKGTVASNSRYYMSHIIDGLTVKDIAFTDNVNIASSQDDTKISNVTFSGCSFTGDTTNNKNQALRYYNEHKNGAISNLTVKDCKFSNCYQGIYTGSIVGVTVTGCTFDTTGHNAIAIQNGATREQPFDHGMVVISNNTFENIGDRIIRFNNVGADTQLTITNNTATNSGDDNGEVMKATSLAEGIVYAIGGNNWGEGTKVANSELEANIIVDEGNSDDMFGE